MTGKSLLITPPSEPTHTTASTRLLRSLKGVRHWWTPRHAQQNTQTEKEQQHSTHSEKDGIAMTLTATIGVKEDTQTATALHHSGRHFMPTSNFDTTHSTVTAKASSPSTSAYNARAFVHYDPTKASLALGADPDASQTQAIWLSLERYTWLISQLQEEQNVYTFLKNCSISASVSQGLSGQQQNYRQSAPPPTSVGTCLPSPSPSLNWYPFLCTPSPILGVLNPRCDSTTPLSRRLSRFVHRGSNKQQYHLHHQHHHPSPSSEIYLFMIPKALLLQAAAYIPMTKPLPPAYSSCPVEHKSSLSEKLVKQTTPTPFSEIPVEYTQRLKRYVQLLSLTAHDLMATPNRPTCEDGTHTSKSISYRHDHQAAILYDLICERCGLNTSLGTVTSATSALSAAAAMEASQSLTTQNGTDTADDLAKDVQQQTVPSLSIAKTLVDKKLVIDPTFTIIYFQPILNTSTESAHLYGTPRPYSHSPQPNSSTKKERETAPTFNTFPKRQQQQQQQQQQNQPLNSGIHHGSVDHLSCSDTVSTSGVTSGSFSMSYQKTSNDSSADLAERKGYVAIDHTHQEIIVVFPGLPLTRACTGGQIDVDSSFFIPVPWIEEGQDGKNETMDATSATHRQPQTQQDLLSSHQPLDHHHQQEEQQRKRKTSRRRTILRKKLNNDSKRDTESASPTSPPSSQETSSTSTLPWVLNGALTAWRRCELNVATLLMRACKSTPQHYRVVMVGSGLGSAVASLCALSLVSTGLLSNRSVTYCGIHPPRIGDHNFGQLIANQNIETIRIMHPNDIMAHLPPRTSGLTHIGDSTIIDNKRWMIQGHSSHTMEDIIDRTLPAAKTFHLERYGSALDIDLYALPCLSSLDSLTVP